MHVLDPNNIKVYNLSAGKSLPDWLSERKRRALQKKSVDIRRRIELLQDFEMPAVSNCVRVSPDGQYILATGIYKPRVRCYDVNNLSMKFERCFDSEVVTFDILSEDYSKLVFLQCDRHVEFHAAYGRYYRLRIPRFGRDMKYHHPSCDMFLVGAGPEIFRLNLERGQFLNPHVTQASEINCCALSKEHQLLVCGTKEGRLEAWDPRSRQSIGILDCAINCTTNSVEEGFPAVTAVRFHGGLHLGVGTATGHVLLYDIRSNKPFLIKDHMYGLPILDVDFHSAQDLVLSMDSSALKIWEKHTGKLYTSIEAESPFNSLCLVPDTGMMFIANESTKVLTYYIPSIGPAPRWCGFLDTLTEELEESKMETVYDDYKFVTHKELEELGLDHLIGTNLLRAYMHGFFVDIRLYNKAKAAAEPFAFEEYKKKKIREKIEEERSNRVKLQKLPSVNKELALKLMEEEANPRKMKKLQTSLLSDDRFKALFDNPNFEVDKNAEEYRLLNPVLSRLDKGREKMLKKLSMEQERLQGGVTEEEEPEGRASSDESSDLSSDEEREMVKEMKLQHRQLRAEAEQREWDEAAAKLAASQEELEAALKGPKFYELQEGQEIKNGHIVNVRKQKRVSLGERVASEGQALLHRGKGGSREFTFKVYKNSKFEKYEKSAKKHHEERQKLARPGLKAKISVGGWRRKF